MPRRKLSTASQRKPLPPGARVFAYARDSGGVASEKSVADQVRELEAFAREHGLAIVRVFADEARKAGDMEGRDAFLELVAECRRTPRPVDAVLVWSFHRLFRDEVDAAFFKNDLRRRGVEFLSATQRVPEEFAVLYEALLDTVSRIQIDQMAVDVRRGLRAHLVAGYAPPGTPPTGYLAERIQWGTKRDGTPRFAARWVVDPEKAPLVRQSFMLWATGHSIPAIHAATRLLGSVGSYATLLRNRSYLGIAKFGQEEFENHHPALVDAETWEKAQARMTVHKIAPRSETEYLLTGMLFCGECGRAMESGVDMRAVKNGKGNPWRYYRCRGRRLADGEAACRATRRVNAARLEHWVLNTLLDRILTPENVRAWMAEVQAQLADAGLDAEIARLDAEIGRLRRAIGRVLDLVETGDDSQEVRERLRQRQADLARAEVAREALVQRKALAVFRLSDLELARILEAMRGELLVDEVPVAKRTLQSFVERVEVKGEEAEMVYRPEVILAGTGEKMVPPRGLLVFPCTRIGGRWKDGGVSSFLVIDKSRECPIMSAC